MNPAEVSSVNVLPRALEARGLLLVGRLGALYFLCRHVPHVKGTSNTLKDQEPSSLGILHHQAAVLPQAHPWKEAYTYKILQRARRLIPLLNDDGIHHHRGIDGISHQNGRRDGQTHAAVGGVPIPHNRKGI
ncbi:hypothetical protein LIER_40921 [Lithospermum erythrorhizon]|uniref:Uncharacterized protein n=1 Tax=Lithospermum erythrorhizon TaxID=34254 RepID=A0AAV3R7G6_LITER